MQIGHAASVRKAMASPYGAGRCQYVKSAPLGVSSSAPDPKCRIVSRRDRPSSMRCNAKVAPVDVVHGV